VDETQLASFQLNGHVLLKGLLAEEDVASVQKPTLDTLNGMVERGEHVWPPPELNMATIGCHSKEYVKAMGLWRRSEKVRQLVLSSDLGKVAATLLGVSRVRLYSDAVYMKHACDKYTRFHRDIDHLPLNVKTGTLWIPLTAIDRKSLAPLVFISGSHLEKREERASNISGLAHRHFWENGTKLTPQQVLDHYARDRLVKHLPLALGDATFHDGRVLHGADHNREKKEGGRDRIALAITYFEDGARLEDPDHEVHLDEALFWQQWVWELQQGDMVEHALMPMLAAKQ